MLLGHSASADKYAFQAIGKETDGQHHCVKLPLAVGLNGWASEME